MKYLRYFENASDYEIAEGEGLDRPNVSYVEESGEIYYNPTIIPDYFKITALEDSTISLVLLDLGVEKTPEVNLEYSRNGRKWIEWDFSPIQIIKGEFIYLRGDNPEKFNYTTEPDNLDILPGEYYHNFRMTGKVEASGYLLSLGYKDEEYFNHTLGPDAWMPCSGYFLNLFAGCQSLVSVVDLKLPQAEAFGFYGLFSNTGITQAPNNISEIYPSGIGCFMRMFAGSKISIPPKLYCDEYGLYDAPHGYRGMFYNCTSLTTPPELPAITLNNQCYDEMFYGCTSLTTAPELPATTLNDACYYGMFDGCTSLTTAPELPATTLADDCYGRMFYGCTSLNYIKMLATDISATECLTDWVKSVASTGTFIKHPDMTSLPTGNSGIPSGWTVQDAEI